VTRDIEVACRVSDKVRGTQVLQRHRPQRQVHSNRKLVSRDWGATSSNTACDTEFMQSTYRILCCAIRGEVGFQGAALHSSEGKVQLATHPPFPLTWCVC
jgi:hypothetical protein